jgi:RNA polymerase sigma-70 factor (ECF subfamily)
MAEHQTTRMQLCLDRLQAGDHAARGELLAAAGDRLSRLTRAMLRDYQRVRRWEETADVLQNALLRLHRALEAVTPASLREFYRLAALQVRRELIDLARHHYGPEGPAAHQESVGAEPPEAPAEATWGPTRLAAWAEFHEQAGALPEDEREVFDLLWYQGLTHAEAAALLGVSTKTVQRRWQAACLRLHEALGDDLPS